MDPLSFASTGDRALFPGSFSLEQFIAVAKNRPAGARFLSRARHPASAHPLSNARPLQRMVGGDILVDEDSGVFDDRPLAAVLEPKAVFVGGGEGLPAGGDGAVEEGAGKFGANNPLHALLKPLHAFI